MVNLNKEMGSNVYLYIYLQLHVISFIFIVIVCLLSLIDTLMNLVFNVLRPSNISPPTKVAVDTLPIYLE